MSGIQRGGVSPFQAAASKITSAKPKNFKPMAASAQAGHGAGQVPAHKPDPFQPGQGIGVTNQGLSLIG